MRTRRGGANSTKCAYEGINSTNARAGDDERGGCWIV